MQLNSKALQETFTEMAKKHGILIDGKHDKLFAEMSDSIESLTKEHVQQYENIIQQGKVLQIELQQMIDGQQRELRDLHRNLVTKESEITKLQEQLQEYQTGESQCQLMLSQCVNDKRIADLQTQLDEKEKFNLELSQKNQYLENEMNKLKHTMSLREQTMQQVAPDTNTVTSEELERLQNENKTLNARLKENEQIKQYFQKLFTQKDDEINSLKQQIKEMESKV